MCPVQGEVIGIVLSFVFSSRTWPILQALCLLTVLGMVRQRWAGLQHPQGVDVILQDSPVYFENNWVLVNPIFMI